MTPRAAHIRDADPSVAKKRPDPSPIEHRLGAAARRFAAAAVEVEDHTGPRSGPEYAAKIESWRQAYEQLVSAARAIPGEQP